MESITVEEWAADGQHPELSDVLYAMAQAAAQIAAKIRRAGIDDVYGAAGATNVQGEQQQKLDVFANEVMTGCLRHCIGVAGVVSEEDDGPVLFHKEDGGKRFAVSFDPLDGSSNIDVNVNVGTIFGIRLLAEGAQDVTKAVLALGTAQVAAGYVLYGPSVVLVATVGDGVSVFTLNDKDEFVQTAERVQMPEKGAYYSCNEANAESWPSAYREYLAALRSGALGDGAYSARYIGSLVADFHRTLLKGGVFLYPPTDKAPEGKLRLQYEADPLAMLAEKAGGMAVNGTERILEVEPTGFHQRTPLVIGSRREVELLQQMVREAQ